MGKFENVTCDLCGLDKTTNLYSSKQYGDEAIGAVNIKLVMCENCNFIYQNPQLTSETLKSHYAENSSGDIFRLTNNEDRAGVLLAERKLFIEENIASLKLENICDIGGGSGKLLSSLELSKSVKKYLVEPSDAIDKNKDHNVVKIKSSIEDIHDNFLPKLNVLMCISTLEHLKKPLSVLSIFADLLSEDGYLIIEVPDSLKPYAQFADFFTYEHVNHFTYKTLLAFLDKNEFYPIKIEESQSVSTIRVFAQKYTKEAYALNIVKSFKHYQLQKDNFTNEAYSKLKNKLHSTSLFCVYGAGDHTRFLLETLDFLDKIQYFIDSDPKKWGKKFYKKLIVSPGEIINLGIDSILISSHDFEEEIYKTIKDISDRIDIITIYRDNFDAK